MKIVFHCPRMSYSLGGAEVFARMIAEGLSRREGWSITLSVGKGPSDDFMRFAEQFNGMITYYPLIKADSAFMRGMRHILPSLPLYRRYYSPQYYWDFEGITFNLSARHELLAGDNDVVFVQYYMDLAGIPTKKPIVFCFHGVHAFSGARRLLLKATHFIAPCHYLKERVKAFHGIDVAVIPLPVDCVFFAPDPVVEKQWDCLLSGRLAPSKGVDLFLGLARRMPQVSFAIAGDGPMRPEVMRTAEACDNVTYLGCVAHYDMPHVYNASRLCVVPSRSDIFPYVVLEAMACGVPVIASRVGGIPEALDQCDDLLIAPGDHEGFAATIKKLLGDNALRNALGEEVLSHCHATYDQKHIIGQWAQLFQERGTAQAASQRVSV